MALQVLRFLKKGTYRRVRGYAAHVKSHPGTWYGIDDGCKVGNQGQAPEKGKASHVEKKSTGGGWNFRFYPDKYPGNFFWLAHNSQIPYEGQRFNKGQKMFKTGATGGVSGPHLHHSLLTYYPIHRRYIPRNTDNKDVVQWQEVDPMVDRATMFRRAFRAVTNRFEKPAEVAKFLKSKMSPEGYVRSKFLIPKWVPRSSYDRETKRIRDLNVKLTEKNKKLEKLNSELEIEKGKFVTEATELKNKLQQALKIVTKPLKPPKPPKPVKPEPDALLVLLGNIFGRFKNVYKKLEGVRIE